MHKMSSMSGEQIMSVIPIISTQAVLANKVVPKPDTHGQKIVYGMGKGQINRDLFDNKMWTKMLTAMLATLDLKSFEEQKLTFDGDMRYGFDNTMVSPFTQMITELWQSFEIIESVRSATQAPPIGRERKKWEPHVHQYTPAAFGALNNAVVSWSHLPKFKEKFMFTHVNTEPQSDFNVERCSMVIAFGVEENPSTTGYQNYEKALGKKVGGDVFKKDTVTDDHGKLYIFHAFHTQ